MKRARFIEFSIFFGALILVGAGLLFGARYVNADQSNDIIRHFQEQTAANQLTVETPATSTAATTTTTTKPATPVIQPSTPATTVAVATPAVPPPPAPVNQPAPATVQVKTLPYSVGIFNNSFASGDGWTNWWGYSSEDGGVLTVAANASTTGGGALLQGSDWSSLTFQATVDWYQGETFGMVAHYIDNNNYLVCQFDEKNVGDVHLRLDEHLNGNVIHLADGDVLNYLNAGGRGITSAIQVAGNQGMCAFNGYTVSSLFDSSVIDPSLSHGEIGFTDWDPTIGTDKIVVKNIGAVNDIVYLGTHVGVPNPQ